MITVENMVKAMYDAIDDKSRYSYSEYRQGI